MPIKTSNFKLMPLKLKNMCLASAENSKCCMLIRYLFILRGTGNLRFYQKGRCFEPEEQFWFLLSNSITVTLLLQNQFKDNAKLAQWNCLGLT